MNTWLWLVEGPLFWLSLSVFGLGAAWKVIGLLMLGGPRAQPAPRGSPVGGAIYTILRHFVPRRVFLSGAGLHAIAGYAFHVGLFILLGFAAPHVAFFGERLLGISWPTLPRWGFIVAAEFAFAGLIILWAMRISEPIQKLVSRPADHAATWLTFLVMLSGCLALEEAHVSLRALHMTLVDVWLFWFPFSPLMHTFTFLFSRGFTGAAYGRRGVGL